MIVTLHPRSISATDTLHTVLHERASTENQPLGDAVIAYWPHLTRANLSSTDLRQRWSLKDWAEFFEDPLLVHPFAAHPDGEDRRAIFHLSVRPHPDDPDLSKADLAHIAMHLASVAGISDRDGDGPHRWIALQTEPGRLDLVANLIHDERGTCARQPRYLQHHLNRAAHQLEDWLDLTPTRPLATNGRPADIVATRSAGRGVTLAVTAAEPSVLVDALLAGTGFHRHADGLYTQPLVLSSVEAERRAAEALSILRAAKIALHISPDVIVSEIRHRSPAISTRDEPGEVAALIDQHAELLPRIRRLAETAAVWTDAQPDPASADTARRLEWIARRLHSIEEDLRAAAGAITAAPATTVRPALTAQASPRKMSAPTPTSVVPGRSVGHR